VKLHFVFFDIVNILDSASGAKPIIGSIISSKYHDNSMKNISEYSSSHRPISNSFSSKLLPKIYINRTISNNENKIYNK